MINMAVKDKLELERLYAILDDLESMYRDDEISEETYTEMKKNYKKKISDIQDRIMDLDGESGQKDVSRQVQEAMAHLDESTAQISKNVNEILKETMRSLKMQLKSAGVDSCCKTYSKEDSFNISLEEDQYLSLKCHLEWGKIEIRGKEGNDITIHAEKKSRADERETGMKRLENIGLNCKSSLEGNKRIVKINPDLPKWGMVDFTIEVPNRHQNTYHVYNEKGKITFHGVECDECEIENENGNIDIRNLDCRNINITTETSSIAIEDLIAKGEVEIYNENGNIRLTDVKSDKMKAYTEKGHISAQMAANRGSLKTELGSISYANIEDRPQQINISSELGSIKVKVDEGQTPWTISAKVDLGSIKNSSSLLSKLEKVRIFESSKGKDVQDRIMISTSTDLGSIEIEGA